LGRFNEKKINQQFFVTLMTPHVPVIG